MQSPTYPLNRRSAAISGPTKICLDSPSNFLRSIQAFQSEAQATAFAFGENCVHSDGSATFISMETDFNVTLQVPTLADEAALGVWIEKVMQVIESIPAEQIIGPRPGRVSILFASPDN